MRLYQLHAADAWSCDAVTRPSITDSRSQNNNSYDFKSDDEFTSQSSVEIETNDYLTNAKNIASLHKFPTVKKLFMLCNTPLLSSAPVERLSI